VGNIHSPLNLSVLYLQEPLTKINYLNINLLYTKMEDKITLIAKRKSIQQVFDYCLDQKITFSVEQRGIVTDEFEISLTISNIKQAVALGMFAKEFKFDVSGLGEMAKPKLATNTKKPETKEIDLGSLAGKEEAQTANGAVLNF
jgi:hypothetical protein